MLKYLKRIFLGLNKPSIYKNSNRKITTTQRLLNEDTKGRTYGQTTPVQKILRIKDFIDYLVYGSFGIALYYVYQRYKKSNELKEELKAALIEIKEFKSSFFIINGFHFPEFMIGPLKDIKNFTTRKEDIWVTSFPKSGNTLTLKSIITSIITKLIN